MSSRPAKSQKGKSVKELNIPFMKKKTNAKTKKEKYLNEVSGGIVFYFYVSPWPSSVEARFFQAALVGCEITGHMENSFEHS